MRQPVTEEAAIAAEIARQARKDPVRQTRKDP